MVKKLSGFNVSAEISIHRVGANSVDFGTSVSTDFFVAISVDFVVTGKAVVVDLVPICSVANDFTANGSGKAAD